MRSTFKGKNTPNDPWFLSPINQEESITSSEWRSALLLIHSGSWGFLNAVIQISIICMLSLRGDPGPFGCVLALKQSLLCVEMQTVNVQQILANSRNCKSTLNRKNSTVDVQWEPISNYDNYLVANTIRSCLCQCYCSIIEILLF